MKITQLDLFATPSRKLVDIKAGELFLYKDALFMRIKPVAWLLNSSLIQDKITRGYVFVVDMETGKVTWYHGGVEVEKVTAELKWSK